MPYFTQNFQVYGSFFANIKLLYHVKQVIDVLFDPDQDNFELENKPMKVEIQVLLEYDEI